MKYTFKLDSLSAQAKGLAIVMPLKYQILVFKNPEKFLVQFKDRVNFGLFNELESAQQLADILLTIQNILNKKAIEYMKRYLMLEPDASDTRASQDKIYEWEVML